MSINQNISTSNKDYEIAAKIKKNSIVALVLCFFVLTIPVAFIMQIVVAVKVLSHDWSSNYAKNNKTLFGVLMILLSVFIGSILGIVFGNGVINERTSSNVSNENTGVY